MASYNKIQLVGTIEQSPDVKATTNGHSLSKFTLIVPRLESLPNERFDHIPITAWRDNADKSAHFKAGDIIYVDGRILTNSFDDEQTGQRKWTTEVDARQLVNFSEVFNTQSVSESSPSAPSLDDLAKDIDNLSFTPVDESSFFNETSESDTSKAPANADSNQPQKNNTELEEDVPF